MKSEGFTLLEVLVVMIILSVLAGFVAMRGRDDAFRLSVEAETLKAHIRYVRHLALVNDVHSWEIRFRPDRYALFRDGSGVGLTLPNENSAEHRFPRDIAITVVASGSGLATDNLRWDKWGRPADGTDVRLTLADAVTGQEATFRINPETGLVQ